MILELEADRFIDLVHEKTDGLIVLGCLLLKKLFDIFN